VAAGEQPAVETPVMDQEEALPIAGQDQAGAGDMAGRELAAREGLGRALEDHEDQLGALESFTVAGQVSGLAAETADHGRHSGSVDHGKEQDKTRKPPTIGTKSCPNARNLVSDDICSHSAGADRGTAPRDQAAGRTPAHACQCLLYLIENKWAISFPAGPKGRIAAAAALLVRPERAYAFNSARV